MTPKTARMMLRNTVVVRDGIRGTVTGKDGYGFWVTLENARSRRDDEFIQNDAAKDIEVY